MFLISSQTCTFHRCDDHGENLLYKRRTPNIAQKRAISNLNYTKKSYLPEIRLFFAQLMYRSIAQGQKIILFDGL